MIEFDNQKTINEIVASGNALVILYYATWCMPCKSIAQSLLDLKINFSDTIQIITVNVDEFSITALEQNVKTIPTVQYYKNGLLYLKESGFRTRDQLTRNMDALITVNSIEEE